MREDRARIGTRVKIVGDHVRPDLAGQKGTIVRAYNSRTKTALHVRLDDGRWQLLWPHEVEPSGDV